MKAITIKRIMVVSDNLKLLKMMRHGLEGCRYVVTTYPIADAAWAGLKAKPGDCDLLITDFELVHSEMSGTELCTAAKTLRADLPVMMMIGYPAEEVKQTLAEAGVDRLLKKPFTTEELLKMIAEMSGN